METVSILASSQTKIESTEYVWFDRIPIIVKIPIILRDFDVIIFSIDAKFTFFVVARKRYPQYAEKRIERMERISYS